MIEGLGRLRTSELCRLRVKLDEYEERLSQVGRFPEALLANELLFYTTMHILTRNCSQQFERGYLSQVIRRSFCYQNQLNNPEETA